MYLTLEFITLFLLGGLIALNVIAGQDADFRRKVIPNQPIKLVYTTAIIILSLFALFIIVFFVGKYCMRYEVAIKVKRYVAAKKMASVRSRKSIRKERNSVVRI